MIGVIADSADHAVVREFFELFKTPWEFFERIGNMTLCFAPAMLASMELQSSSYV